MRPIDETHRADLDSWVESAAARDTDFPLQNLPLGCFRAGAATARPGIAIGDQILDLGALGDLADAPSAVLVADCVRTESLNPLLAAGAAAVTRLRRTASRILRADTPEGTRARTRAHELLVPAASVELLVPARIGNYTDFYASIHHATNVGSMFRPDNPLLPNYKWVPIGYHGRASSVIASGRAVRRPTGQTRDENTVTPVVGPTRRLDYELEVGAFIAAGNPLGHPIAIHDAETHVAGLCLVNDWSARDIQTWEYQPLGPFLSKSFTTSVSPWIVSLDALAPFRMPAFERPDGDPAPLPYLNDEENQRAGGIAVTLEVALSTSRMRANGNEPARVSLGNFATMYWTIAQMVTHHASNGCNLQPGDLIASGTVSGPTPESRGCLLERTWRGTEPLTLPTGESRRFLEDGDEVIIRGWCERAGYRRIGFGECRGRITPS